MQTDVICIVTQTLWGGNREKQGALLEQVGSSNVFEEGGGGSLLSLLRTTRQERRMKSNAVTA